MRKTLLVHALFILCAPTLFGQSLPADTTTYEGTDISGKAISFRRPPDSLMEQGVVLIRFRPTALDKAKLLQQYEYWYTPHAPMGKGGAKPLGGPTFYNPGDPRGYPFDLRKSLFSERFYLDSASNIVRDTGLCSFMKLVGGRYLHRLTAASPYDTLSITRLGDTIGCDHFCWMILELDTSSNPLTVAYLLSTYWKSQITGASPDYHGGKLLGHPGDTASDGEYLHCQRNTKQINAEAAWWYEVGSREIKVAVIDAGADYHHPDFMDPIMGPGHKFYTGWNFDEDNDTVERFPGHGTEMSGIIGARTNNMLGAPFFSQSVAGIAGGWDTLPPLVIHRGPGASLAIAAADIQKLRRVAAAIFEASAFSPSSAYGWGAHTLNISEGTGPLLTDAPSIHACINYAFENAVTVSAAKFQYDIGTTNIRSYPADEYEPWVIATAGAITDKSKVIQSDYGYTTDLLAPSGSTDGCDSKGPIGWTMNWTTRKPSMTDPFSFGPSAGNSAATANTSGAIALLQSHFHREDTLRMGDVSPEDYGGILKASAWRGDKDRDTLPSADTWRAVSGWGHLDIGRAFEMLDPDSLQHPWSGYQIFHYAVDDTDARSFGDWHSAGQVSFGPSYDPIMADIISPVPTYGVRRFQVPFTGGPAEYRRVTYTISLPNVWYTTDSLPLFAWGRSGNPTDKSGWELSSPLNYETGWSRVTSGTGWDPDSLDEGIFHNSGTTFTVETGQWRLLSDTTKLFPPDSLLGANFTVFGKYKSKSSVRRYAATSADSLLVQVTNHGAQLFVTFASAQPTTQCLIQVFDILGHELRTQSLGSWDRSWSTVSFDIGSLPAGYYVVRFATPFSITSEPFLLTR